MHKRPVFFYSLAFSIILIIIGIFAPQTLENFANSALNFIYEYLGWFILGCTFLFFLFCMYLAFSKYGKIRLGDDDDRPKYNRATWIAMLFATSIGISLVFWGVAEPVSYYIDPPYGEPNSEQSAKLAMQYVFLHWGVSAWAIYAVVGVCLAYFLYRKKLPASISSTFQPLVGEKIFGNFGNFINIIVSISIIIGLSTSLGFGTLQINSGFNYLWGLDVSFPMQLIIIASVTTIFVASAVSGIDKGIKNLSNTNMILAFLLMAFVFVFGPTQAIFKIFFQGLGDYVQNFISMSFRMEPYQDGSWIAGWTLFYFGWWIAWAPLVGSFVARISRGRTIREFMLGAVFIPVLAGFLWFSVMGGSALHFIQNEGKTAIANAVAEDVTSALFIYFEHLPLTGFLSILAIILVLIFFVTSADSATFVLAMLSENGNPNPTRLTKIVWGFVVAAVSAILIFTGGIRGLQSALVTTAVPLAIMMLFMCYSMIKGLQGEFSQPVQKDHKTYSPTTNQSSKEEIPS